MPITAKNYNVHLKTYQTKIEKRNRQLGRSNADKRETVECDLGIGLLSQSTNTEQSGGRSESASAGEDTQLGREIGECTDAAALRELKDWDFRQKWGIHASASNKERVQGHDCVSIGQ